MDKTPFENAWSNSNASDNKIYSYLCMSNRSVLLSQTRVALSSALLPHKCQRSDSVSCTSESVAGGEHSFSSELDSYINTHLNLVSSDDDDDNDSLTRSIAPKCRIPCQHLHHEFAAKSMDSRMFSSQERAESTFGSEEKENLHAIYYSIQKKCKSQDPEEAIESVRESAPVPSAHPFSECSSDALFSYNQTHQGHEFMQNAAGQRTIDADRDPHCARSPSEAIGILLAQLHSDTNDTHSTLRTDFAPVETLFSSSSSVRSSVSTFLSPVAHQSRQVTPRPGSPRTHTRSLRDVRET
jgi:hypothetical protein